MTKTIAAIILTYNEEQHIERCIESLKGVAEEVFIIDSFSDDKTIEIAEGLGAIAYKNPFVNHSVQFNWALKNCKIKSDWILRIDADEYVDNKNNLDLSSCLSDLPNTTNGLLITRKIVFMGQQLLHGGWYPKLNLRLFKKGFGVCENKWMDEHIVLTEGSVEKIQLDLVDENLNNLKWWIGKHNNYSDREAFDYFLTSEEQGEASVEPKLFGNEAEQKRWLKVKYNSIPLFVRPIFNFIYRYFFKLGFLDGKEGLVWHVLQGFWYRFLVDAKIIELNKKFKGDNAAVVKYINDLYTN